jgi:hypothetical protein
MIVPNRRKMAMKKLTGISFFSMAMVVVLGSSAAYADHGRRDLDSSDLLLGIASSYLASEVLGHTVSDRPHRSRYDRGYRPEHSNSARGYARGHSDRDRYRGASYTSEPIRGGSSRRTRIIENPYPNRPVSGISFAGIEHDAVHINDVITYPRKRVISRGGYSLSLYHPSRFLNTRGYVDYISVKAKRKEYFTVTFHYD